MTFVYRVAEAAELLAVCPRTLRRRIAAGEFPNAYREGRELRIPASDLRAYQESRPKISAAPLPDAQKFLDELFGPVP